MTGLLNKTHRHNVCGQEVWLLPDRDAEKADFDTIRNRVQNDSVPGIVNNDAFADLTNGIVERRFPINEERPVLLISAHGIIKDIRAKVSRAEAIYDEDFTLDVRTFDPETGNSACQDGSNLDAQSAIAAEHGVHDGRMFVKPRFAVRGIDHQTLTAVEDAEDGVDEIIPLFSGIVVKGRAGRAETFIFKISHANHQRLKTAVCKVTFKVLVSLCLYLSLIISYLR